LNYELGTDDDENGSSVEVVDEHEDDIGLDDNQYLID